MAPERWADAMDGATLHGHGLHGPPVDTQVGIINVDFYVTGSSRKHDFTKGMYCQIIRSQNNAQGEYRSLINVPGITEYRNTTTNEWHDNIWVPASYIDVKGRWETDINKFKQQLDLVAGTFEPRRWEELPADWTWAGSVLGKTIQQLIAALHTNPASFLSDKLDDLVKTTPGGVNGLTDIIITGIRKAGLYDVLNENDFTITDLYEAATDVITDDYRKGQGAGIYMRIHRSGEVLPYWKPDTSYVYVGKTVDFLSRLTSHRYATSKYGDLTRNSAELSMFALCMLEPAATTGLFFLAEQIFTCLLETYRSDLDISHATTVQVGTVGSLQHAIYFKGLSRQVFAITGWPGGVSRSNFGVQEGANWSSPLLEWDLNSDKTLYIRTDSKITDKNTLRSIDVSSFRSANPSTVPPGGHRNFHLLPSHRITIRSSVNGIGSSDLLDGSDPVVPIPPNTKYHLVMEVYKDGTPHPEAWAQLPDIRRFKNWNQANSLAVRIEWQDPTNPVQLRFRYIKRAKLRLTEGEPASIGSYGSAIALLPWLFGCSEESSYDWVPKMYAHARVIQATYDMVQRTVTFGPQKKDFTMLSDQRLSDAEIRAQMEASPTLKNIGFTLADWKSWKHFQTTNNPGHSALYRSRIQCDLCLMTRGACDTSDGSNQCTYCRDVGLPVCSFTPDLASGTNYNSHLNDGLYHKGSPLNAKNLRLFVEVRKILLAQPRIYPQGSFHAAIAQLQTDQADVDEDDADLGISEFFNEEPSVTDQDDDLSE